MFPPPWWIALNTVSVVSLAFGLIGWFAPAHPLATWQPGVLALALAILGGIGMLLTQVVLIRMILERQRSSRR
jgi:hypothetical protein